MYIRHNKAKQGMTADSKWESNYLISNSFIELDVSGVSFPRRLLPSVV